MTWYIIIIINNNNNNDNVTLFSLFIYFMLEGTGLLLLKR